MGRDAVITIAAGFTRIVKPCDCVNGGDWLSATVMVKLYDPAVVTVPVN